MVFNVDGRKVKVSCGYDEYVKIFEEHVLPEFKDDAESCLLEMILECDNPDGITCFDLVVEAEKTKNKRELMFVFEHVASPEDEPDIINLEYCRCYED